MINQDQSSRLTRGICHQDIVLSLFEKLKDRGLITKIETNHRIGYPEFPNGTYYFPFALTFADGVKWLIQSTTCYPRERVHGYQWNAFHSKILDTSNEKIYVVYPDSMSYYQISLSVRYNRRIENGEMYSSLDGLVSFADLYLLIEEKWLENEKVQRRKALQGTAFEKWLVDILTNPVNVEIYNRNGQLDLGFNYPYFNKIITFFGVSPHHRIEWIRATYEIPLLPPRSGKSRGGKPKTDIFVELKLENGDPKVYTISSKRTSSEWVAINQYGADVYIDVLGIQEQELKDALFELERTGAPTQISPYHQTVITQILPKYHYALALWAYAGIGGEGDPNTQWAEYFTIYKNETKELEIYHRDEYIHKILTEVHNGQLGSPFTFTYTGERGTNIQLRGKVI
jgi:hypothetical protein